ncbi:hypothetical protein [Roseateles sp. MS654]|uniref:hypothetical protein n=1 Tax=Roseateles sp. MS654 TaxID=3412685 RepID=UPI003C2C3A7B
MNIEKARKAERLIARRYEMQGYAVTIGPSAEQIPFSLNGYRPDLLATNGKEQLLVEVNTSGTRLDTDLILSADREVQRHPGWKFLIVTVPDDQLIDDASSGPPPGAVTPRGIGARLAEIDRLGIRADTAGFAVPALWTVIVVSLRSLLSRGGEAVERYTDLSLVNRAYSFGYISSEDHEALKRFLALRNEEVHGLMSKATAGDCEEMRNMAGSLLAELRECAQSEDR